MPDCLECVSQDGLCLAELCTEPFYAGLVSFALEGGLLAAVFQLRGEPLELGTGGGERRRRGSALGLCDCQPLFGFASG